MTHEEFNDIIKVLEITPVTNAAKFGLLVANLTLDDFVIILGLAQNYIISRAIVEKAPDAEQLIRGPAALPLLPPAHPELPL